MTAAPGAVVNCDGSLVLHSLLFPLSVEIQVWFFAPPVLTFFCRTSTLCCPYLWVVTQDRGRNQGQNHVKNLQPSPGKLQCTCLTDQLWSQYRWSRIWFCTLWCIWVIPQGLRAFMPISSPFSPKNPDNWRLFFSLLTWCTDQVQLRLLDCRFHWDFIGNLLYCSFFSFILSYLQDEHLHYFQY